MIHECLSEEIVVFIFKKLDYKSMMHAYGVCKTWNKIINTFELLKVKNFCKYNITRYIMLGIGQPINLWLRD